MTAIATPRNPSAPFVPLMRACGWVSGTPLYTGLIRTRRARIAGHGTGFVPKRSPIACQSTGRPSWATAGISGLFNRWLIFAVSPCRQKQAQG